MSSLTELRLGRRSHWTAVYLRDRLLLSWHEHRHPADPWLTTTAVDLLDQWIRSDDRVLEWGSGRSTRWLAARAGQVFTVEHDVDWSGIVGSTTRHLGVELSVCQADDVDGYVGAHPQVGEIDLALVDGIHRDGCALRALDLLRPGAVLVVDNVERYLPSTSRSPEAIGPSFESTGWEEFATLTSAWRCIWTTNGVTDTALFFKP